MAPSPFILRCEVKARNPLYSMMALECGYMLMVFVGTSNLRADSINRNSLPLKEVTSLLTSVGIAFVLLSATAEA